MMQMVLIGSEKSESNYMLCLYISVGNWETNMTVSKIE